MTIKYNFYVLPFVIVCSFLALDWFFSPPSIEQGKRHKDLFYTAHNLVSFGLFSHVGNTGTGKGGKSEKAAKPGRHLSPGLPFLVAGYALIDSEFRHALSCFSALGTKCSQTSILNRYFAVQFLFIIGGVLAAFYLAFLLSGSREVALLTMLLLLFGSEVIHLGKHLQSNIYQFFILYMALIFLVLMYQKKKLIFAILAGIFFGILILFQSHFIFGLFFAIPLVIIFLVMGGKWRYCDAFGAGLSLLLGISLFVGLWAFRNYQIFGDFWINPYENAHALSDRIAYNEMSVSQGFMSILHFLPSYASDLGDLVLSSEFKEKLGMYVSGSYVYNGTAILRKTMIAQPNAGLWFSDLAKTHIFSDTGHHLLISIPLFLRGLWAGGSLVTLAGLFFISKLIKIHLKRERFLPLLLVFIIMLSFTAAFALVTPAIVWFNLPIAFIYCYAISYVVGCL